jgi:hypothetical protein
MREQPFAVLTAPFHEVLELAGVVDPGRVGAE